MSNLMDEDEADDFSEQDYKEDDEDFEETCKVYKKKRKTKREIKNCHFCGKSFFYVRKDRDLFNKNNHLKCLSCRKAGVTRKITMKTRQCGVCREQFEIPSHIVRGQVYKLRCPKCKDIKEAPKGPLPKPKNEYYECDICGKRCKKRHLIYQHMDNHRTGDDLECKVCHKTSRNRSVLRTHLKTHFEQFICHICGFVAKTGYTLRHHMEAHNQDPNQVLDFSNAEAQIKKKNVSQRGEFSCKHCGHTFQTQSALHSHELRRHQPNARTQDFTCKECGEIFHHAFDLRAHNFTHSNRPLLFCDFPGCNQFFNRIKPLNAHKRNVHKEMNISCEVCNKKFKMRGSLVKHLRNNRCIPVQIRKVTTNKFALYNRNDPRRSKTVEQLHEEANIAKEQFKAMGGLLKDENWKSRAKKKKNPKKTEMEKFEEEQESSGGSESSDDSSVISKIEDIKCELESDTEIKFEAASTQNLDEPIPLMKIEVKMEPTDEFDNEEFSQLDLINYDSLINESNAPINDEQDDLNPSVVLEKLDYDTVLRWQLPKKKEKAKKLKSFSGSRPPRIFKDRYNEKYRIKYKCTCDECGESFQRKNMLKEHLIAEHGKETQRKRIRCPICRDSFYFMSSLKLHKKEKHSRGRPVPVEQPKPFICDICGNEYTSYTSISSHLKIVHRASADFCCHICPSKFKTRMYLVRHIEDVHEKIHRYQCNFCGKFFKRKHQVKEHEKGHNDPVPCNICGKMVKNLRTHVKQVHQAVRKVEDAQCPECGQMVRHYGLQAHIDRIHRKLPIPGRSYPCDQCSENFSRSDDLRRHKYMTHNDKPFKVCPFEGCGGIFQKTKALNVHIKDVHRSETHQCQYCPKSYSSYSGIRKHMRNKHKEFAHDA